MFLCLVVIRHSNITTHTCSIPPHYFPPSLLVRCPTLHRQSLYHCHHLHHRHYLFCCPAEAPSANITGLKEYGAIVQ